MIRHAVAVALVHAPVLDRRGDLVTTAVTNLDIHDIARTARTYGVGRFYVVTPVPEQRLLVDRILAHWRKGAGSDYNPHRGDALSLVETVDTLEDAVQAWTSLSRAPVLPVLTGASRSDGIPFGECARRMKDHSLLLVFGTGWGLAPEHFERGWTVLDPIRGGGDYNHLPVRAAVAIILDRLITQRNDV